MRKKLSTTFIIVELQKNTAAKEYDEIADKLFKKQPTKTGTKENKKKIL